MMWPPATSRIHILFVHEHVKLLQLRCLRGREFLALSCRHPFLLLRLLVSHVNVHLIGRGCKYLLLVAPARR